MPTVELAPTNWGQNDWSEVPAWSDPVAVVADAFGTTSTRIEGNNTNDDEIYTAFNPPTDLGTATQIDFHIEAKEDGGDTSIDADLRVGGAGAWEGVVNQTLTANWAEYWFGAWTGTWTRDDVASMQMKFTPTSKNASAWIATVRLRVTYTYAAAVDRSGHGPDALRIKSGGAELVQTSRIGTVPGVAIDYVAALNDTGSGTIRVAADGKTIQYKAPGSSAYGASLVIADSADVTDILRDGDDPDKYVRVTVDATELPTGQTESRVDLIRRRYWEGMDITAAEASTGTQSVYTIALQNDSDHTLSNLCVWIDASVSRLEISDGAGGPWVSPTTEAAALVFPDVAPAGSVNLYVRRTIESSAAAAPGVPWWLHMSFDGGV